VAVDTLVAGVHFPTDTAPDDVGHKALAVNLSDLAAVGAEPIAYSLGLVLPGQDPTWLDGLLAGLAGLADAHRCRRLCGHIAEGPLAVTVEAYGHAPPGAVLRRSGARPGDALYVSGTLGDAGLALGARLQGWAVPAAYREGVLRRLNRPEPRLALGAALRGVATSAIDVSDGLAADLGHILRSSAVGATVEVASLPLSAALRASLAPEAARVLALSAGDDYELCFTAPEAHAVEVERLARGLGCAVTRIGRVEAEPGLRCVDPSGAPVSTPTGYEHFVAPSAGDRPA
jgi:thiamine-monophosphate kinase